MSSNLKQAVENEAREAYQRFIKMRDDIDAGIHGWDRLADFFTEDAVYIDPAWGRWETRGFFGAQLTFWRPGNCSRNPPMSSGSP